MKHARLDTPEGTQIVRADGTVPRPWNTDCPVLHLLPELLLGIDAFATCPCPRVSCTVFVLSPSGLAFPEKLIVRQPFPNRRYLVAGTDDSRYGFLVPLPSELLEEIVIRLEWRLTDAEQAEAVRGWGGEDAAGVDHVLRLRFGLTERGQVFSTDTSAWPTGDVGSPPSCELQPFAVLSERGLPSAREGSAALGWNMYADVLVMDERLDVPGILLSDVWGFSEFEEEQLHEVGQTAVFHPASPGTLAHHANACTEMPAVILVEAVRLARDIPYGKGTVYAGSMAASEKHPALLALCGWWNANAPDPLHRHAGLCMPWMRVRDDGEYWCAYYETPTMAVDHSLKRPEMAARVGDVVLIEFAQGQGAATFDPYLDLWGVGGNPWNSVGVSENEVQSGEHDEGWYTLEGLAAFPERFPAAWAWLTKRPPGSRDERAEVDVCAAPEVP